MTEKKPAVEILGRENNQDDDLALGTIYESLCIRARGKKHYILFEESVHLSNMNVKTGYRKVEFPSIDNLMEQFERVRESSRADTSLPWIETDATCGYAVSEEEFQEARRRHFGF